MILVQAAITAIRGVAATAIVPIDVVEMTHRATVLEHVTTAAKASADTTATMMSTATTVAMMTNATANDPMPATVNVVTVAVTGVMVSVAKSVPAAKKAAATSVIGVIVPAAKKAAATSAIGAIVRAATSVAGKSVVTSAVVMVSAVKSVTGTKVSAAKIAPAVRETVVMSVRAATANAQTSVVARAVVATVMAVLTVTVCAASAATRVHPSVTVCPSRNCLKTLAPRT